MRLHCGRGTRAGLETRLAFCLVRSFEPGEGEAEKYRKNSIKIILA